MNFFIEEPNFFVTDKHRELTKEICKLLGFIYRFDGILIPVSKYCSKTRICKINGIEIKDSCHHIIRDDICYFEIDILDGSFSIDQVMNMLNKEDKFIMQKTSIDSIMSVMSDMLLKLKSEIIKQKEENE